MLRLRRPPTEIAELRQRRDELARQLAVLHKERDLEVRAAEKLAQDAQLKEREARLSEVEASLEAAELVAEADGFERKQSWELAIRSWERIVSLFPSEPEPAQALARLNARREFDVRLDQVTAGVMPRRRELDGLWDEVRSSLQQMRTNGRANEEALILLGELVEGKLDAPTFARDWRDHQEGATRKAPAPGFEILADRLRRGDMALLVGSEVACDFSDQWPGNRDLARELAHQAGLPIGVSLATVAEYYDLSAHGRPSLVRQLRERLPVAGALDVPLYQLLAGIAAPLVVVSAALDGLLEAAFRAAGKSFVVVSPLPTSRTGAAEVVVRWSDVAEEKTIGAEELSGLKLLARYSLIFKVRGAIAGTEGELSAVTPTLAEREHFVFARRQQILLPTYLARLLDERGLLILGWAAGQLEPWEDRLLLDAVLDRRQAGDKPFVARKTADRFEQAYWQRHATHFDVSLPELTEELARHLRSGVGP